MAGDGSISLPESFTGGGGGWRRAGLYFSDGRREEMEVSPDEESIAFPQALGVMETVLIALDKEQEDR